MHNFFYVEKIANCIILWYDLTQLISSSSNSRESSLQLQLMQKSTTLIGYCQQTDNIVQPTQHLGSQCFVGGEQKWMTNFFWKCLDWNSFDRLHCHLQRANVGSPFFFITADWLRERFCEETETELQSPIAVAPE